MRNAFLATKVLICYQRETLRVTGVAARAHGNDTQTLFSLNVRK